MYVRNNVYLCIYLHPCVCVCVNIAFLLPITILRGKQDSLNSVKVTKRKNWTKEMKDITL